MTVVTDSKWRVIAIVVLGMVMASPVAAQPSFGFGVYFGDDDHADPRYPELPMCLTDHQIREAITRRGFTDVSLNVPHEKRIQVRASRDGAVYLIDFDFCADRIRGAQQIR